MELSVEYDFPDIKQANCFFLESLWRPGPGLMFQKAVLAWRAHSTQRPGRHRQADRLSSSSSCT